MHLLRLLRCLTPTLSLKLLLIRLLDVFILFDFCYPLLLYLRLDRVELPLDDVLLGVRLLELVPDGLEALLVVVLLPLEFSDALAERRLRLIVHLLVVLLDLHPRCLALARHLLGGHAATLGGRLLS